MGSSSAAAFQTELDELHQTVRLGAKASAGRSQTGFAGAEMELLQKLEREVYDPIGSVPILKDKVVEIASQIKSGGGGVESHSMRFNSPEEISTWLGALDGPGTFTIFHVAVPVLQCIGIA
jgi:hypothetical protein